MDFKFQNAHTHCQSWARDNDNATTCESFSDKQKYENIKASVSKIDYARIKTHSTSI